MARVRSMTGEEVVRLPVEWAQGNCRRIAHGIQCNGRRADRSFTLAQEQRHASQEETDVLDESAQEFTPLMARMLVGFHPRSCQAKSPEHSSFTAHFAHSDA